MTHLFKTIYCWQILLFPAPRLVLKLFHLTDVVRGFVVGGGGGGGGGGGWWWWWVVVGGGWVVWVAGCVCARRAQRFALDKYVINIMTSIIIIVVVDVVIVVVVGVGGVFVVVG